MYTISYNLLNYLLFNPFQYIISITENMYLPNIATIITELNDNTSNTYEFINDTIETSIYNIEQNFNFNEFNNYITKYKLFILLVILFITILIYLINNSFDKYLINIYNEKFYQEYNRIKNENLKNNNIQKFITKGLFVDSILEMHSNNNNIINKIKVNTINNYSALIRVKLKNSIEMHKTKYNLENIKYDNDNDNDNGNDKFKTNDMYLIITFKYEYNEDTENNESMKMSQTIINIMNIINSLKINELNNDDFIVLAISKDANILNFNEFYNGLKNINYDLNNAKKITLDSEKNTGFMLFLPVKDIYDLFLDVYNNIIFESTSYKINYDNNEFWYNNSINDIFVK